MYVRQEFYERRNAERQRQNDLSSPSAYHLPVEISVMKLRRLDAWRMWRKDRGNVGAQVEYETLSHQLKTIGEL